jgi:uncharacterized protein involved in exopolysaccharide biosynthesis
VSKTFDAVDYLNFFRARWKFAAVCVGAALLAATAVCLLTPNEYTATATLLIEPPPAADPRGGGTVTPIYLESLKSYEQLAASDSLFLKACQQFGLLEGPNPPAVESLKRRVLRVDKLKDTKILQIGVTLRDARKAQAMAQYLAEETVNLNRSIALENDKRALDGLRAQAQEARSRLNKVRVEHARVMAAAQPALAQEIRTLGQVLEGLEEKASETDANVAELTARTATLKSSSKAADARPDLDYSEEQLAGAIARKRELASGKALLEKQLAEKSSRLAEFDQSKDSAFQEVLEAEATYRDLDKRQSDLAGTAGMRTEQLRLVDPGIVPQRPSFPNPSLVLAAALLLSFALAAAWITLQYGLDRQRQHFPRGELRVTRSASR